MCNVKIIDAVNAYIDEMEKKHRCEIDFNLENVQCNCGCDE
jgi:hypothetical protein